MWETASAQANDGRAMNTCAHPCATGTQVMYNAFTHTSDCHFSQNREVHALVLLAKKDDMTVIDVCALIAYKAPKGGSR